MCWRGGEVGGTGGPGVNNECVAEDETDYGDDEGGQEDARLEAVVAHVWVEELEEGEDGGGEGDKVADEQGEDG